MQVFSDDSDQYFTLLARLSGRTRFIGVHPPYCTKKVLPPLPDLSDEDLRELLVRLCRRLDILFEKKHSDQNADAAVAIIKNITERLRVKEDQLTKEYRTNESLKPLSAVTPEPSRAFVLALAWMGVDHDLTQIRKRIVDIEDSVRRRDSRVFKKRELDVRWALHRLFGNDGIKKYDTSMKSFKKRSKHDVVLLPEAKMWWTQVGKAHVYLPWASHAAQVLVKFASDMKETKRPGRKKNEDDLNGFFTCLGYEHLPLEKTVANTGTKWAKQLPSPDKMYEAFRQIEACHMLL